MERTCDYCGTVFNRSYGTFCSPRCAYDARRKTHTAHRRIRVAHGHPLAGKTGRVSEARYVLFNAIGWGPHPCHWCGKLVDWTVGRRGNIPDALVADHVNSDPLNDALENLVAACGICNAKRARAVEDDELYIVRTNGTRLRALKRTCEFCGDEFPAAPDQVRAGRARFCSRSCARRAQFRKAA